MIASSTHIIHKGKVSHYIPLRFGISWRKRYLVLTAESLHIYKSENHANDTPETVNLGQLQSAYPKKPVKGSSAIFQLEFQDPSRENLEFRCSSEGEMSQWINHLQGQIKVMRSTAHSITYVTNSHIQSPSVLDKWLDRLQISSAGQLSSSSHTPTISCNLRSRTPDPSQCKNMPSSNTKGACLPRSTSLRSSTSSINVPNNISIHGKEQAGSLLVTSLGLTPPPHLRRCATVIRNNQSRCSLRESSPSSRPRMRGITSPTFGHAM